MKTEDTVEYNSLRWVKKELDLILSEAQSALSLYIEEKDESRLRECADHLHMVHGTLQMVELYGAAQLAEEMYKVAAAVLDKSLANEEDAYDVLMRSMLQLPDYLESLQAGSKDVPMVLLPLLNDLRASRNASLLSENVLFFPDIEAAGGQPQKAEAVTGQLQAMAKKLRPHYQIGLLGWFRGQKVRASQKRILAVLNEFEKISADPAAHRLWSVSAALIEGLMLDGLDSNVSVKMLMGQVDRNIHHLIKQGEIEFAKDLPAELLKNLLYYVARIEKDSPKIKQIKETYHLKELLPDSSTLEEARSGLGGLNTELLRTVSQGIREDLLEVKDTLEIFVHSEDRNTEKLSELPQLLNKIADTLAMLGLGGPREQVLDQRTFIENIVAGSKAGTDDEVMGIASVLLSVESQLNNFIASRSSASEGVEHRVGDLAEMPSGEYQEVLSTVIGEALQDFNSAKQAIIDYLENTEKKELLTTIYDKISVVCGAMFMLPLDRLEPQLKAVLEYVDKVLIKADQQPDEKIQDSLADVITSIEYYLEAVLEGRPGIDASFASGDAAAQKLIEETARFADEAATVEPPEEEVVEPEISLEENFEMEVEPEAEAEEVIEVEEVAEATPPDEEAPAAVEEERYIILGDDADEEILEIFIEEALEELESLNEYLPKWLANADNEEALTTIRRSFHTLKGSGRLIGAQLIGEFSWSIENLLNKVMDKTRPADQDVFDVLQDAVSVLPQLVEQLKGNREPVSNIYTLIDKAELLAKKRQADEPPVAAEEETAESEEDIIIDEADELDGDIELTVDDSFAIDISEDELQLAEDSLDISDVEDDITLEESDETFSLTEDTSESAAGQALTEDAVDFDDMDLEDDFNIDLTEDLQELQLAITPEHEEQDGGDELVLDESSISIDDEVAPDEESLLVDVSDDESVELKLEEEALELEEEALDLEDSVSPVEPETTEDLLAIHADPVLFEIYKNESEAHLAQLREMLELHNNGEQKLTASPELVRALHTLYGSARTAEVEEIAELSGSLEKYVRALQSANLSDISDQGVSVISAVTELIASMLDTLSDPSKRLRSDKALLSQIDELILAVDKDDMASAVSMEVQASEPVPADETAEEILTEETPEEPEQEEAAFSDYGDVDDELVDIFLEEAEELVDGCENSLQRWGNDNSDVESVNDLQRLLHTLKGGARMADLSPIGDLTHALESLIIAVNNNQVSFSKPMSNVLNDAMDALSDMLANVKNRAPIPSPGKMIRHLDALRKGEAIEIEKKTHENPEEVELEEDLSDLSVLLEAEEPADISTSEVQHEEVIELEATEEKIPAPHEDSSSLSLAKEDTVELNEPEEHKSAISHEQVRVRSDLLNTLVNNAGEVSVYHARMGQQVSSFSHNLGEMEQTVIRLRDQLRKLTIETEAQILSRYEKESDQYDVDFDPLEMDRFSTLQQISRSLSETVNDIESIKDILVDDVRDAETLLLQESRVSTELQEGLMRTRMVHFGGLASRLRRIVRQTSRELGKDVSLEIIGETTEVDRTVLDRIIAPLEHMLRNAVSHGIEKPDERTEKGKDSTGHISISVDREGSDVVIKVVDDGRGIDVNAIRNQAVRNGLLDADSGLSDRDILQFIMEPGFSTATEVTQISGRGVGMDVVDSEIKQLGGVLEIDTVIGSGTSFTVRLPLTLAINHALLVNVGEDVYAVPLNSIEGVVRLNGPELQSFYDSEDSAYQFAGTRYELRHLGRILHGQQPDYSRSGQLFPVLLARVGEQRVALHVDELLGRREIVVKPVGPQISTVRGISGATILGDGRVVLILEMNALVLGESLFHVTGEQEEEIAIAEPEEAQEREPIVMVVDDSITIRKVTERILGRHGMQVITAKDGVDAVAQLQEQMPDVMLLDIEMPRMDGYEVATHVRNDERLKDLPIIMITSRTGSKHRDKAMEIGVNKYLGKPYQEDELMETINELIG